MKKILSLNVVSLVASALLSVAIAAPAQTNSTTQPTTAAPAAARPTNIAPPNPNTLKRLLKAKSDDAKTSYNAGVKHGRAGRFEEAAKAFRWAIQLKPDYADAYFGLGHAYSDMNRWREAAEAYEQAVRLNPKDEEAYAKLGQAYLKLREQSNGSASNNALTTAAAAPTQAIGTATTAPPPPQQQQLSGGNSAMRTAYSAAATRPTGLATGLGRFEAGAAGTNASANNAFPTTEPVSNRATTAAAAAAESNVDLTTIYRVGSGDILDVRLLNEPTNQSTLYTVAANGLLEYPLAGAPLQVAGLTTDEIRERLVAELKRRAIQQNPEMSVGVREYASHNIIVSGLASDPGTKTLRREAVPLYVIIADAQPRSEAKQAVITSSSANTRTVVDLTDLNQMQTLVRPGDIVTLQERAQQFFYIGGEVSSPGQKEFHPSMTLTQAILSSGGELSSIGIVKIMRQGANGLLTSTSYNLKEVIAGKVPDPLVQPNDRIGVTR